ncbi:hypothetical protein EV667_1366 [Ancylobacter aquaticus]|uniref:Uncharacterized protein n=1 Tax=Ancylobacter aquaticus TaxID=100 RepID=A0A4R1ID77_ANCAQ|nr:hypothetical protein [Ancylobacter aquaticus]TCK31259.1 hypothetical protein EV667_1366 [Ancylobacter aquaticus]
MRGKAIASAAVFAGFMLGAAGGAAEAYEFTGTFAGGDCRKMAAATPPGQLWYGHFTGRRQSPWNVDFIEGRTADGCFRSKAECDNWLYQWRSAWQLNFWNDYCVKGWPPKARPAGPRTQVPFGQ